MRNKIFIGDNLKIMESDLFRKYLSKINIIYIDPPYNTRSNKSYKDNIHSLDWRKFIMDRLLIAREFMSQDGVIFISIDDNEYANLKIMCDKIFGIENHLGTFITKQAQRSNAKHINTVHEYVLTYSKNKSKVKKFKIKRINIPEEKEIINNLYDEGKKLINKYTLEEANSKFKNIIKDYVSKYSISWLKNYNNLDEEGNVYFAVDLSTPGDPRRVSIPEINLNLEPLPTRGWSSDKRFLELHKMDRLVFKDSRPYSKKYLNEATDNAQSILNFYSRQGTRNLKELGLQGLFDTPKPVELIKYLIRISSSNESLILDFFAGSGTTAQAVYEINCEDNSNLRYILIQLDEYINEKNKVYKRCTELGIYPRVDKLLIHRINVFLEKRNLEKDYEILKLRDEVNNEKQI